jgi:hypothetical protein
LFVAQVSPKFVGKVELLVRVSVELGLFSDALRSLELPDEKKKEYRHEETGLLDLSALEVAELINGSTMLTVCSYLFLHSSF